ncbi:MAG: 50S ribosomal protein L22 [Leptonema illini]|uniref:Large ribosomal subunit protein uL22 n=2 Tax=Leptonema illini TaxID=183 RepID=H2CAN1_9LEPT|nr:50S ribosomal protein L22 [Leptonema illini]EHQ08409.1 LSU ribosomal protein L22P [Leptonema illini DSM 21528]KAB2930205.1 MAG: 50S ribosomal protein L22 [Leptonema illini]PKL34109.1 MAG: 50S ribosomal protein L22 [Spirochaetae bacterium HGW-Spirochaetae-10]
MEAKAVSRFLMISPRKVRLVADEVRGFPVDEALNILQFMPKKGARFLEKAIQSAKANLLNNSTGVKEDRMFVKKVYVDQGPTLKRFRPRARGRAMRRLKKTSNITVVIGDE